MKISYLLIIVILLFGCNNDDSLNPSNLSDYPNILLIIADDLGKDAANGFAEGSIKPNTPNIDRIKNEGLLFNNFWVYPTCSPTRASMITGKYGYSTGVKWAGDEMSQSEITLQKYINEETNNKYAIAIVGKWHLSGENANINPETFGIDYYAGLIRGAVQDYYRWQLTEDGNGQLITEYATKVLTDLSIEWVNEQTQPWFLWLAYNAPHTPFHNPPSEMHTQGSLDEYNDSLDPIPFYMAAIEAMDYQIGQLINAIPASELDNTVIFFIGDNGTPNQVAQFPYSSQNAKGSLYQGGINVPMMVSGKNVSRTGIDNNLICSTDLFCTISELAGVENSELNDSKSFKTLLTKNTTHREYQYSEKDDETTEMWTISNGNYKLIVDSNGSNEMYDLTNDPYENSNLLIGTLSTIEENAKMDLEQELTMIRQ